VWTSPRSAVNDFAPSATAAKSHAALFTQTVRGPSLLRGVTNRLYQLLPHPVTRAAAAPGNPHGTILPSTTNFVAFGNLTESATEVASAWMFDVRSTSTSRVGQVYRGAPTARTVRKIAHQSPGRIILQTFAGFPGVGSTQIAASARAPATKEVWGNGLHGAHHTHSLSAFHISRSAGLRTPTASTSRVSNCEQASVSGQICMYSFDPAKSSPSPL